MANFQHGGNIFPSLSRTLSMHGEPLTVVSNIDQYDDYTTKMGHDPADSVVDELFKESAGTLGRVAEKRHRATPYEHLTVVTSLLNESVALMPDISSDFPKYKGPIRQAGSITIDLNTNSQSHVWASEYLSVHGLIFDNGNIAFEHFIAGQHPNEAVTTQDFMRSSQMRVISELGLRGLFDQVAYIEDNQVDAIVTAEDEYILDEDQTNKLGTFVWNFFNNDSGIPDTQK